MKRYIGTILCVALFLSSCNTYNEVYKSRDYEMKYEAAKEYFLSGQYNRAHQLLDDMLTILKGSDKAEESLFMDAMCYLRLNDYETASIYFERYYKTYPKGTYAELARYYSGVASYNQSPDPRLDQTPTYTAINRLQEFLDLYPYSDKRNDVNDMIFQLQNRLVDKEYGAAKLYFNLGSYTGNCANGGSNYEACIITAENALKTYPFTEHREELYWLILRARYLLASNSIEEKSAERYRETIDEYYGFKNEFPDSKHIKDADAIFKHANNKVKNLPDID